MWKIENSLLTVVRLYHNGNFFEKLLIGCEKLASIHIWQRKQLLCGDWSCNHDSVVELTDNLSVCGVKQLLAIVEKGWLTDIGDDDWLMFRSRLLLLLVMVYLMLDLFLLLQQLLFLTRVGFIDNYCDGFDVFSQFQVGLFNLLLEAVTSEGRKM